MTKQASKTAGRAGGAPSHEQWLVWMRLLLGRCTVQHHADGTETWTVPAPDVLRWRRRMETAYADLGEAEKDSDRTEADRVLAIVAWSKEAP